MDITFVATVFFMQFPYLALAAAIPLLFGTLTYKAFTPVVTKSEFSGT